MWSPVHRWDRDPSGAGRGKLGACIELSPALGAMPSHRPQQGGPQLPASTYQSTAKHRSYDEQRWKAEASDLHNGLVCHAPPTSCLPPCTLGGCIIACSPSLPLLTLPSKVLKSKPGNRSGWQAQEASLGQAHWSQLA